MLQIQSLCTGFEDINSRANKSKQNVRVEVTVRHDDQYAAGPNF